MDGSLKTDIDFAVVRRYRSTRSLAEWLSTIMPLCGRVSDADLPAALWGILCRWRQRVRVLKDFGWYQVQESSYVFARNCRPCSVEALPENTPSCRLRPCPFCHARTVGWVAEHVHRKVVEAREAGRPAQVLGYLREFSDKEGHHFDMSDDLSRLLLGDVLPKQQQRRSHCRRKHFKESFGDYHWIGIDPVVCDEWRSYFRVRHAHIALMPLDWEPPELPGVALRERDPSGRKIAAIVARTMRYPVGWLSGDENLTAMMLNVLHDQRLLTKTGCFRNES